MHRFLRAVGFSNISSKQDMDKLLGISMDKPSVSKQILSGDSRKITELSHEFAHNTGITIRGEYDKLGFFHVDHYFPYCSSSLITMRTDVTINKRVDTNAYTGMCDDIRMAVSVIFYLQNSIDYMKLKFTDNTPHRANLALSGLSLEGRILLGIQKTNESINVIGKEFQLLELFMHHKNQVLEKEQIFIKIWGYDSESDMNTLEAYISFLRKKLKLLESKINIKSIRNIGYKFEVPEK